MAEFQLIIPGTVKIANALMVASILLSALVIWRRLKRRTRLKGKFISLGLITAVTGLFIYIFVFAPMQTKVLIGHSTMEVHTPPYAKEIVHTNEVISAYEIDLVQNEELTPAKRVRGMAMGDYRVGLFRLQNGESAAIMASDTKVMCIELEDRFLLLSPTNYDNFVERVNEFARVESTED